MSQGNSRLHLIYTTLTLNSTTLYTYENYQLTHSYNNLNCSEVISQELGLINASKTLVGAVPVAPLYSGLNPQLTLYFMKKSLPNQDGSNDLITIVSITHMNANKLLVLSVLKKIMDKYIEFKRELEKTNEGKPGEQVKNKLGEFKLYMNQIIKFEEMNYESNHHIYNYGSVNDHYTDAENDSNNNHNNNNNNHNGNTLANRDSIKPNQLLLANEEVDEVRQIMLENINSILSRGDKINLLVDQTDRLNNSSLMFKKKALLIKKRMWFRNTKFYLIVFGSTALLIYLVIGSQCGFPDFNLCFHK